MVGLNYSMQKKCKQKCIQLKLLKKNKPIYSLKGIIFPKAIGKLKQLFQTNRLPMLDLCGQILVAGGLLGRLM